jgi:hypothetical protein
MSSLSVDEEPMDAYVWGGHHHIKVGDTLSDERYVVVRKLSWGVSSIVWLAKNQKCAFLLLKLNRNYNPMSVSVGWTPLKVVKSAESFTDCL